MRPIERKLGWLLLVSGGLALVFFYYLESFDAVKIAAVCFWLANTALNVLLTYDLFHRHDLATTSRTIITALIWIIPLVNWLVFIRNRNLVRPAQ